MITLTINNNKTLEVDRVAKVRPGAVKAARQVAESDGLDNLFFTQGQDTYVATGRGLNLRRVEPGGEVIFDRRKGAITHVDRELNGTADGFAVATRIGWAFGGVTALGLTIAGALSGGGVVGVLITAVGSLAVGWGVYGLIGLLISGPIASYANLREVKPGALDAHVE